MVMGITLPKTEFNYIINFLDQFLSIQTTYPDVRCV